MFIPEPLQLVQHIFWASCPELCAEHLRRDTEWALVGASPATNYRKKVPSSNIVFFHWKELVCWAWQCIAVLDKSSCDCLDYLVVFSEGDAFDVADFLQVWRLLG